MPWPEGHEIARSIARAVSAYDATARVRRLWALEGGVSAQVVGIEIDQLGEVRHLVLRRHGVRELRANPTITTDEYRLLEYLHAAGLAVPKPCFLDESKQIFDTPYLLLEFLPGQTDFDPADMSRRRG
jgi:aminoglycoside phosphotransferase (APT) family kinase protein